jgi:putative PIN family toxin of toxin-antitoxin system
MMDIAKKNVFLTYNYYVCTDIVKHSASPLILRAPTEHMTFTNNPKRIVLDTNVCLDLFVFHDLRWMLLLTAMRNGEVQAVTRADCRTEWQIVLNYPHLPLEHESRLRSAAEFDTHINCLPSLPARTDLIPLPVCSDADDQKFLELARDAGAEMLITKDKALLKLAKRTARAGLFAIIPPEAWVRHAPIVQNFQR